MIILYYKDAPKAEESTYFFAIPDTLTLTQVGNKLYRSGVVDAVCNRADLIGWLAAPEQDIPPPEYEDNNGGQGSEIPRKVKELNLTYFEPGELTELQRDWKTEVDELRGRVNTLEASAIGP